MQTHAADRQLLRLTPRDLKSSSFLHTSFFSRHTQFTQLKADSEVRWAVLNVASILRRHTALHDKLAEAMGKGASVGELVMLIETSLADCDDI